MSIFSAALPAHKHQLYIMQETGTGAPPSDQRFITSNGQSATLNSGYMNFNSYAGEIDNKIYGASTTVQPPAIQLIPQFRI